MAVKKKERTIKEKIEKCDKIRVKVSQVIHSEKIKAKLDVEIDISVCNFKTTLLTKMLLCEGSRGFFVLFEAIPPRFGNKKEHYKKINWFSGGDARELADIITAKAMKEINAFDDIDETIAEEGTNLPEKEQLPF